MLHGIVMDVVEMTLEVVLVANEVLPVTRLPDAAPVACEARGTHHLLAAAGGEPLLRELLLSALDQLPEPPRGVGPGAPGGGRLHTLRFAEFAVGVPGPRGTDLGGDRVGGEQRCPRAVDARGGGGPGPRGAQRRGVHPSRSRLAPRGSGAGLRGPLVECGEFRPSAAGPRREALRPAPRVPLASVVASSRSNVRTRRTDNRSEHSLDATRNLHEVPERRFGLIRERSTEFR